MTGTDAGAQPVNRGAEARPTTGIGIVGCGFVSDYYLRSLAAYPDLSVVGVADRDPARARAVADVHAVHAYTSFDELLADDDITIVVNLTNPRSHFDTTGRALEAGRHVYSEKPLAMEIDRAVELVELAERLGVQLSGAPCSLLGEAAQTLWRAVRDQRTGTPRVVYAQMDEGLVHRMPFDHWVSESGAPWPHVDEFEVGTVIEHAGYVVSWLPAMFGPVTSITGFSDCLIPVKAGVRTDGTDFSVAVLRFASGTVARLTCSLIAPHDHSLQIVGDRGVLSVDETWDYATRVHLRRSITIRKRHQWLPKRRLRSVRAPAKYAHGGSANMDFARGVHDLADAVRAGRTPRLSARYCLHVNEVTLALTTALRHNATYAMSTTCEPVSPMPWAERR